MRLLVLAVLASALLASCAHPSASTFARQDDWDAYASAVEESVWRYEHDAEVASRAARPMPLDRYAQILRASLATRGLTLESFLALQRTAPRFFFTQEALYAVRLQDAEARAAASAGRRISRAP